MRILSYIGGLLSTVIVKSELFPLPGGQRHKPGKGKSHGAKKKQGGGGVAGPGHGAQGDLILQNIVPLFGHGVPELFVGLGNAVFDDGDLLGAVGIAGVGEGG